MRLKPALCRVWRGPGTVQIGLDPRYGTVLDGLTPEDRALLDRLGEGVSDTATASRRGAELVRLLTEADVLVTASTGRPRGGQADQARLAPDVATWSVVHGRAAGDGWSVVERRRRRRVDVVGGGRVGLTVASTLACAGVGRVRVRDGSPVAHADICPAGARQVDVGQAREVTAQALLAALTGRDADPRAVRPARVDGPEDGTQEGGGQDGDAPDVVVRVEHGVADAAAAQALMARDVPHLSVVVREGTLVVGPLVLPGVAPCLRCLDLHRTDRDRGWPRVLAHLQAERHLGRSDHALEETASAQLAGSLAALQVLGHLDGLALPHARRPASVGATLEVELPDGLVSRREWPAHAACGCIALPEALPSDGSPPAPP